MPNTTSLGMSSSLLSAQVIIIIVIHQMLVKDRLTDWSCPFLLYKLSRILRVIMLSREEHFALSFGSWLTLHSRRQQKQWILSKKLLVFPMNQQPTERVSRGWYYVMLTKSNRKEQHRSCNLQAPCIPRNIHEIADRTPQKYFWR
jgi:hypothetical protein